MVPPILCGTYRSLVDQYVDHPLPGSTVDWGCFRLVTVETGYWYVDRPLLDGSAKNRPSAVDLGRRRLLEEEINRRRSIEREIDRWRSIKEEKGKKKRKRRKKEAENTSPARRRRLRVAHARGRFFSRARRRSVSPRGEKDRGDVAEPFLSI
ncbi:hypothetical protein BHM03_00053212, partial [Ensete ventricosum]